MAIAELIPILESVRGAVGDVVLKQYGSRIVITRKPVFRNRRFSGAQKAAQERFREAALYANRFMTDPRTREFYQRESQLKGKPARSLMMADFLHAQPIQEMGLTTCKADPENGAKCEVNGERTSSLTFPSLLNTLKPRSPMKVAAIIVAMAGIVCSTTGQTFQDFLSRVNAAPDSERTALVDSFMTAVGNLPLRERDTVCHFIYRGGAGSVTVPGDANGWDPAAFPMSRLSTTDLWYVTRAFESDARLDYKFMINGVTWILDPRNPYTVNGGFGPNSELRMPAYVPAPEIQYYPSIPHGTLRDTTYYSVNLNNSRTVRIYTPPGYEGSSDSFGVILFHDGLEYVTLAQANNTIDYLIWQNRIRPIIAVFVPPVNRVPEYRTTQINQFSAFIANEIMPYVDLRYRTQRSPEHRAVLGSSDGGNITLWLALNYSQVFGNAAAQSSNIISSISSGFRDGPRLNLKLYLDLGTYDIAQLIPLVRSFITILQSKGYEYEYQEYHEGHSWGNWRAHVDNALEMFFPPTPEGVNERGEVPRSILLEQNYPNPFNPTTTIRYTIPAGTYGRTSLQVYDMLGREVATLVNEEMKPGQHETTLDSTGLSSGVYFYRFEVGPFVEVRKLVVLR